MEGEDSKIYFVIGDKRYRSTVLTPSKCQHIIVDKEENIFYTRQGGTLHILKKSQVSPQLIKGIKDGHATDVLLDEQGKILVSTFGAGFGGFYQYNYETSEVEILFPTDISYRFMVLAADGSTYVSDFNYRVYRFHDGSIAKMQGYDNIWSMAFDSDNGVYYSLVRDDHHVYVVRRERSRSIPITGLAADAKTHNIVYDKGTNYVFMCRSDGLYYLRPPSTLATLVPGSGDVQAVGFDFKGNIYMGTSLNILKLIPCNPDLSTTYLQEINAEKNEGRMNVESDGKPQSTRVGESCEINDLDLKLKAIVQKMDSIIEENKLILRDIQSAKHAAANKLEPSSDIKDLGVKFNTIIQKVDTLVNVNMQLVKDLANNMNYIREENNDSTATLTMVKNEQGVTSSGVGKVVEEVTSLWEKMEALLESKMKRLSEELHKKIDDAISIQLN